MKALLATTIGKWIAGGALALILAYGPVMYGWGTLDANARHRVQRAAEIAAFALDKEKADATAAMQRADDARILAALDQRIKELQDDLDDPDGVAFSGADADRVRDLWR